MKQIGKNESETPWPARRDVLGKAGALASALAFFAQSESVAQPRKALNPTSGLDYARLRASLDGRPAYWLSRGVKYALSDFEITPIHGFNMLEGIVYEPQADGSHLFRIFEAPYASDLDTGEVIDVYTNPLTGEAVPIPHINPLSLFYAVDGSGNLTIPADDPRIGKVEFSGFVQPRQSFSTEVLSEERFVTRSPAPPGSLEKPALTELINYTGAASSLSDNGDLFAEARKSIVVFRNGIDGPVASGYPPMLLALYEGLKFLSFDDAVQEAGELQMERTHPGFLERLEKFT
jgi:hypothetical protein